MPAKAYETGLLRRLRDRKYASEYLSRVLESETQEAFLIAIRNVIDAQDTTLSKLADETGTTRQGLYKILSQKGNPRLSTLNQLLKSLGMQLRISGGRAA